MANDDVLKQTSDPNNWASQSGDYTLQRYSKLDQINRDNVKNVKVAWTFSTGVLRGHEGSPLVIGDTLYAHTPFPNIVYALDLNDENKIIWKYEPKQDPSIIPIMCCDTVNRGVAYADGKIFLYQADTTLVALDAKTGKELWKTVNGDTKRGETGTNAPIVIKDKVIVGISGAEFGVQGYVTGYNIADGSRAWRAYTIGPDDQILLTPKRQPRSASRSVRTYGCRRLGGHRSRRGPHQSDRWPRRRRRVRGPVAIHRLGWLAHCLLAAITLPPRSRPASYLGPVQTSASASFSRWLFELGGLLDATSLPSSD